MIRKPQRKKSRKGWQGKRGKTERADAEETHHLCLSGKKAFRSLLAAERAIERLRNEPSPTGEWPQRAYECPDCFLYHLTKRHNYKEPECP